MKPREKTQNKTIELLNANTGRPSGHLDERRYKAMRSALLKAIPRAANGITYGDLKALITPRLPAWWREEGWSVSWHIATVKLDLQARGLIENVPGARPMRVRRIT